MKHDERPREMVRADQGRAGECLRLFAAFCAAVALMSAVLYAGSGRVPQKFVQAGAFSQQ
jgi:hypothetical protein